MTMQTGERDREAEKENLGEDNATTRVPKKARGTVTQTAATVQPLHTAQPRSLRLSTLPPQRSSSPIPPSIPPLFPRFTRLSHSQSVSTTPSPSIAVNQLQHSNDSATGRSTPTELKDDGDDGA